MTRQKTLYLKDNNCLKIQGFSLQSIGFAILFWQFLKLWNEKVRNF